MFRFIMFIVVASLAVGCGSVTGITTGLFQVNIHDVEATPTEANTVVSNEFEALVMLKCGVQPLYTMQERELRADVKNGQVQISGLQRNINEQGLVEVYFESFELGAGQSKTVEWTAPGNILIKIDVEMPRDLTCNN